jgi:hypothetical protein
MKLLITGSFVVGLLFLCSTSWAQVGPQPDTSQSETEDMDADTPPYSAFPYGSSQRRPPQRRGAARLGEWICRDEPPPPGHVITRGGSMGSCVGTCASRYIERLRDHMVICAGQKVPEGYDLLGVTTVADCDCVADTENGLIIQLKPGYTIKRFGAVRKWNSPNSADSTDTADTTDMSGDE